MTGGFCGDGRRRTAMNCPASHLGSGDMSGLANDIATTVSLCGSTSVTLSGRNPDHAGGGLLAAAVRPGLPDGRSPWSRRLSSEPTQPGLRAGIRNARSI